MLQTRYSRSKWLHLPCRGNSFGGGQCVRGATVNLKENAGKLEKNGPPCTHYVMVMGKAAVVHLVTLLSIITIAIDSSFRGHLWGSPRTATFFDENSSRKSWSGNLRAMCHGYWRKTGGRNAWPFDIFWFHADHAVSGSYKWISDYFCCMSSLEVCIDSHHMLHVCCFHACWLQARPDWSILIWLEDKKHDKIINKIARERLSAGFVLPMPF